MATVKKSSNSDGRKYRSGKTLMYSLARILLEGSEKWIVSLAGFPAKTSPSQILKAKGCQAITQVFGGKCLGLFARFGHRIVLLKTSVNFFIEEWEMSSDRWPARGMTANGACYVLPTLKHRTVETGYLLWPTPRTSQDYKPVRALCPQETLSKHGLAICSYIGKRWPHLIGK